jgi:hypothetical protein
LLAGFYPRNESNVMVRSKRPRVKPTRGAPSLLNDPEHRSSDILSSICAVMWEEKSGPWPTAQDWSPGQEKLSDQ